MADADNIFDIPDTPAPAKPAPEEPVKTVETIPVKEYKLRELTAQYPGWVAVYDNPEKAGEIVMFPICSVGIVVLTFEDGAVNEVIRHFVALPTGDVRDMYEIENFVCLVAPGQKLEDVVAAVKAERQMT